MQQDKTALERAFEIARAGDGGLNAIRSKLHAEGYDVRSLVGASLSKQLLAIAREARDDLEEQAAPPADRSEAES